MASGGMTARVTRARSGLNQLGIDGEPGPPDGSLSRGYAGATLDAIGEEAGFSKGVIYSQFGSKADLFLALLERRIDNRDPEHTRIAPELPGPEGIRALLWAESQDQV